MVAPLVRTTSGGARPPERGGASGEPVESVSGGVVAVHARDGGREVLRSDRRFAIAAYDVVARHLLLTSEAGLGVDGRRCVTRIEVAFGPVSAFKLRHVYRGLVVRLARRHEARDMVVPPSLPEAAGLIFMLDSEGQSDFVVSGAVRWCEGVLRPSERSLLDGRRYPVGVVDRGVGPVCDGADPVLEPGRRRGRWPGAVE
ncbi:hypothetical protein [Plantactinospora sp. GCM10030261]|uniref:hypothetical protein n=1 Tax=Plantactinospora sp. GCM10030261 TaxID=3273420 RepID=UPI003607752E